MMDILRLEQALGVVFEVEKDKEKWEWNLMSVIMFMRLQNNNEGCFARIRKDSLLGITWN
jgi:hypothetical protein